MPGIPLPLVFPVQGVKEQGPYSAESGPEIIRPDLVRNMRPFDVLEGRMRGGQRRGSGKYFATQINGSVVIQEINTGVQALDPATVVPDTVLFDTDFTALAEGKLSVVDSANFDTERFDNGVNANQTLADDADEGSAVEISPTGGPASDKVVAAQGGGIDRRGSSWIHVDHDLAQTYIITIWGQYLCTAARPNHMPILFRIDGSDPGGTDYLGVILRRHSADVTPQTDGDYSVSIAEDFSSGTPVYTSAHFTIDETIGAQATNWGGPFKLSLSVSGDSFVISVNDNQVGSYTSVTHSGQTRAAITTNAESGNARAVLRRCRVETALPAASFRTIKTAVVAGGTIHIGNEGVKPTEAPGGDSAMRTAGPVSSAYGFQRIFFVDGLSANYQYLDLAAGDVNDWATDVTAGTLPQGSVNTTQGCRIARLYRGRMALSGNAEDPHNWYMSRSGDPFDWDYSPATTDAQQPVAGNNANAGKLEDIVSALIPFQDDLLFMGGDHSFWVMRGDPAAGGRIDNISRQIGIVGQRAWAWDPIGTLYFMGQNGLYRFSAGSASPEMLSEGRLDKTFGDIDISANNVIMSYDRDAQGLDIYISSVSEPAAAPTHWFWDKRTDSFWPDKYPTEFGPTCLKVYDADDPNDRATLLGGYDGYVRFLDKTTNNDDTTAIDSYMSFPIIHPKLPMGQIQLSETQVHTDPNGGANTVLSIFRGDTPRAAAVETSAVYTKTLAAGRNLPIPKRIRGNSLRFKLQNATAGETWAFENGVAIVTGVGRLRKGL